jgi:hypothetical protein
MSFGMFFWVGSMLAIFTLVSIWMTSETFLDISARLTKHVCHNRILLKSRRNISIIITNLFHVPNWQAPMLRHGCLADIRTGVNASVWACTRGSEKIEWYRASVNLVQIIASRWGHLSLTTQYIVFLQRLRFYFLQITTASSAFSVCHACNIEPCGGDNAATWTKRYGKLLLHWSHTILRDAISALTITALHLSCLYAQVLTSMVVVWIELDAIAC